MFRGITFLPIWAQFLHTETTWLLLDKKLDSWLGHVLTINLELQGVLQGVSHKQYSD